jgi:hypothetical protein
VDELTEIVPRLLAATGDVALASLTREELLALGDQPVLAQTGDQQWWAGLSETEQALVRATAERGLWARNLLRPGPNGGDLVLDDGVRIVLTARRMPSWLAVLLAPDELGAAAQIVVSGIDLTANTTSAALIGVQIDGVHRHRLVSAAKALTELTGWLLEEPRTPQTGKPVTRTVEILRPPTDLTQGTVTYARAAVFIPPGNRFRWSRARLDGTLDEPESLGADDLADWLALACGLTGAAAEVNR